MMPEISADTRVVSGDRNEPTVEISIGRERRIAVVTNAGIGGLPCGWAAAPGGGAPPLSPSEQEVSETTRRIRINEDSPVEDVQHVTLRGAPRRDWGSARVWIQSERKLGYKRLANYSVQLDAIVSVDMSIYEFKQEGRGSRKLSGEAVARLALRRSGRRGRRRRL